MNAIILVKSSKLGKTFYITVRLSVLGLGALRKNQQDLIVYHGQHTRPSRDLKEQRENWSVGFAQIIINEVVNLHIGGLLLHR